MAANYRQKELKLLLLLTFLVPARHNLYPPWRGNTDTLVVLDLSLIHIFSRNAAEVLAQLFALTRRAPREAAARLDRESAGLSADLLTNLRQFGSTPTPRQLQALKQHLSLTIGGAFKLFGYSLDGMRGVEGRLNGGRTRFIE